MAFNEGVLALSLVVTIAHDARYPTILWRKLNSLSLEPLEDRVKTRSPTACVLRIILVIL